MICKKCKTEFNPIPPRRVVCAKCIAQRPAHLRDYTNAAASTAAKLKRSAWRKRGMNAEAVSYTHLTLPTSV